MNSNNSGTNQIIPGVRIVPPNEEPIDASTNDVGTVAFESSSKSDLDGVQEQHISTDCSIQSGTVNVSTSLVSNTIIANGSMEKDDKDNSNFSGSKENKKEFTNSRFNLVNVMFFIIVLLFFELVCFYFFYEKQIVLMNNRCTPVSTNGEIKELDLDSTIVKDLYRKVKTNIREDMADVELNDQMKLYLAYRQIATNDIYESHCNKFDSQKMEPFKCYATSSFIPMAFKVDTIQNELKKLFGENTNIVNQNIQLGKSCVGGFQYIEERGEYVQGECQSTVATLFRVDKKLVRATSNKSTIELYEDVKYYGNDGYQLSDKLVSGRYKYVFRLDMNYNYVYVSKTLVE